VDPQSLLGKDLPDFMHTGNYRFIVFPYQKYGTIYDLYESASKKGVWISNETKQYLCKELVTALC
jgi:serine/threonine protein kinase